MIDRLRQAGFTNVYRIGARSGTLMVDGAVVAVRTSKLGIKGRWHITLRQQGKNERGIDAYLVRLEPGPLYLVFPAPLGRTCLCISSHSLTTIYRQYIDDWPTLTKITQHQ